MGERVTFPCTLCGKPTEWIELESMRFFCYGVQGRCSDEEVIHSTREIRKMPRSMVCPITGDQRCHILGLNAAKIIFNEYGFHCQRIDEETLKQLVIEINTRDNLYCCSAAQNLKDKETEEAFLDCFLYGRIPFTSLDGEAIAMYDAMTRIFGAVQKKLGDEHRSPVIDQILEDFEARTRQ